MKPSRVVGDRKAERRESHHQQRAVTHDREAGGQVRRRRDVVGSQGASFL